MRKVVCALLTSAILITGVPGYYVQGGDTRLQLLDDFAVDTDSITPLFNGEEELIGFYY